MNKALGVLFTFPVIAAVAVLSFYYFSEQETAQTPTPVSQPQQEAVRPNPLPTAGYVNRIGEVQRSALQAAAYGHFLRLFGPAKPRVDLGLVEPVAKFRQRINKKPFGIFITPETSPVQPDKFVGFHTGADAEFTEVTEDVPVVAIADGTIISRSKATGYGGVVVVKHTLNGVVIFALYGHLDPASFPPSGVKNVKAGDRLGILGDGHTEETDGARKHLHFSLYGGNEMDFRGYVKTEEELTNWLNPLDFYLSN